MDRINKNELKKTLTINLGINRSPMRNEENYSGGVILPTCPYLWTNWLCKLKGELCVKIKAKRVSVFPIPLYTKTSFWNRTHWALRWVIIWQKKQTKQNTQTTMRVLNQIPAYPGSDGGRALAAGWWICPAPLPGSQLRSAGWWRSVWRRWPCPGTCCPLCCADVQTGPWKSEHTAGDWKAQTASNQWFRTCLRTDWVKTEKILSPSPITSRGVSREFPQSKENQQDPAERAQSDTG